MKYGLFLFEHALQRHSLKYLQNQFRLKQEGSVNTITSRHRYIVMGCKMGLPIWAYIFNKEVTL